MQRALEARFDSNLNAENLDAWMQRIELLERIRVLVREGGGIS